MAKRVYFCFHYQDVIDFRANVVRNHWLTKDDREDAGFFDASIWEEAQKKGDVALKRLINSGLENTSCTCVLIGTNTYERPWVRYEIFKSMKKWNSVFGVHINEIKGKDQKTKIKGYNPFDYLGIEYSKTGKTLTMYEWNGSKWIEYYEIDGSSSYVIDEVAQSDKGNFFQLSKFYPIYDWIENDGYNNFSNWVR
jgi:Thoeris protein ThsB, TIR-like domain